MAPHEQSTHVKVGLLLTQVRGEFLRNSPDEPGGAARAAKALKRAFELLNCRDERCRRLSEGSGAGGLCCRSCSTTEDEARLLEESAGDADDDRGDVASAEGSAKDRMALRTAFLESSYLPFASFLLREVGPLWLPAWDRAASTNLVATQGNDNRSAAVESSAAAVTREDASNNTGMWSPSPRDLFEAFFRPPAVPPSLALLALCEGLSRRAPDRIATSQRPALWLDGTLDSSGMGGQAGVLVEAAPAPDARVAQQICRLLQPFLRQPSAQQSPMPLHNREPVPLLVEVVEELAGGIDVSEGECTETKREDEDPPRERYDPEAGRGPAPLVGGGAGETLASALCLAPQRVANSLGPIAPPDFSPAVFFPAVCRAVVRGTVNVRSSATTRTTATAAANATATGDVWREFTGRLLTAGRASDLADAWLRAMVAGKQDDPIGGSGGNGSTGRTSATEEADVAAWEAWAEGPDIVPEAHAWMMTRLPASRRKSFTEALLRALWPHDGRRGRHHTWWQQHQQHQQPSSHWPAGFPAAACRVLIGRPLLSGRPFPRSPHEEGPGRRRPGIGEENGGGCSAVSSFSASSSVLQKRQQQGDSDDDDGDESTADMSVGLVERLLLQRPLPAPAAEAIADTLAWCDRRSTCTAGAAARFGAATSEGSGREGEAVAGRGLLMGALKRVGAVWAEPSFLNRSPPRQQEFYTRFLLAALRSGSLDGQLGGGVDGDQDTLVILIRGVGSHLDIPVRETRLRGMRVGEAVAALGGTELRFDELDGEREEQRREEPRDEGQGETSAGKQESISGNEGTKSGNSKDGTAGPIRERPRSKKKKSRRGSKGRSAALDAEEKRRRHWQSLPASFGGGGGQVVGRGDGEDDSDLDPDMLLPLGGAGSGSDSEDANVGGGNDITGSEQESGSTSSGSSTDTEGEGYGGDLLGGGGFGLGDDDDDALEAYDLWDDQDDLAKVAEPVYLDQLIEMLRSREKPDTADQHETALRCAEKLVRRNPPDLAHRAPELSRDLLYLEDSFDLECFEARRSGALVATVAAAPESCALYLGSEVWGTGATEGTKLQILDVLVQAASELAGWTRPSGGGGVDDSDGSHGGHPSSSGGSYPSALLQEARGATPQGSIRRQQLHSQQQRGPKATHGLSASAVAAAPSARIEGVRDRPDSKEGKAREGAGGGSSRAANGEGVASVGGTTRRWGYRRGPREQLRRNLFGRLAPVFFYPLAQVCH
ncbi:unnamed protein product [Ectocarpus sp. 12 AP-2014]